AELDASTGTSAVVHERAFTASDVCVEIRVELGRWRRAGDRRINVVIRPIIRARILGAEFVAELFAHDAGVAPLDVEETARAARDVERCSAIGARILCRERDDAARRIWTVERGAW